MKLPILSTVILLVVIECVLLVTAQPGLAQTELNAQLKQALCAQNWGQALNVLDKLKRAAGPEYGAQINLYRARVQVLARQNVKLSQLIDGCSTPSAPSSAPANSPISPTPNNNISPTPSNNIPPTPNNNIPPTPSNNIPPTPNRNLLPVPPI